MATSLASTPAAVDVVVIGGGVIGASVAFHLAEAGVDVLVVERGELAGGSTSKGAGGVRAQFSDPVNVALGARSLAAFERFAERPGAEIDLHQVGYLFLHSDQGQAARAREAVALQNAMGVDTRLLDTDEAARLQPAVDMSDVILATFHPRDGHCTPESVVRGYASGARAHGATLRTGVDVLGIEVSDGRVRAVATSAGRVPTSSVVCCAGAWSRAVGAMAGVDLPVTPLRRQALVTEPLGPGLAERCPPAMPFTIDAATTMYVHREGPGMLLGMSFRGERPGFHLTYSDDWADDLAAAVGRRLPELLDVGIAHRWAGLYEVTPDENGLIGRAPDVSGFWYATGFSGHGFLQAPAVGEVVRDLYLGASPPVDVTSLSADRFAAGRTLRELGIV